jgi:hypothetical protein
MSKTPPVRPGTGRFLETVEGRADLIAAFGSSYRDRVQAWNLRQDSLNLSIRPLTALHIGPLC